MGQQSISRRPFARQEIMRRRALLSLPFAGTLLAGCGARDRRQGEVFAAYLRTLAGLQPLPQGLAPRDMPPQAFEPSPRSVHFIVLTQGVTGAQSGGWNNVDEVMKTFAGVQRVAAFDMMSRESTTMRVHIPSELLPPAVRVDYISRAALITVFQHDPSGECWSTLSEKCPGSQWVAAFSPVGFSVDRRQAVFYFEMHCGSSCGSGYGVLMRQGPIGWEVEGHRLQWIS